MRIQLSSLIFFIDPYCSVQFAAGLTVREKWRTKTHANGGKTPNWNDKHTFNVVEGDDRLNVEVYDEDTGRNDLIGSVCIELNSIYQRGMCDDFFPLTSKSGRPSGAVRVVLQFQPQCSAGAAPPGYGAPPGAWIQKVTGSGYPSHPPGYPSHPAAIHAAPPPEYPSMYSPGYPSHPPGQLHCTFISGKDLRDVDLFGKMGKTARASNNLGMFRP